MKKLLTLTFICAILLSTEGLSQTFKKGDKQVNLGIGLLAFGGYASAEFGIQDNLGVGPLFGYTYYTGGLLTGYVGSYGYGQYRIGARGAYHLGDVLKLSDDKLDPYVALSVGAVFDRNYTYNIFNSSLDYGTRTLPFFNPRVGGRFALNESLGAYAELGWGGSWLQAGVSLKF
jgi:hypothetical protein